MPVRGGRETDSTPYLHKIQENPSLHPQPLLYLPSEFFATLGGKYFPGVLRALLAHTRTVPWTIMWRHLGDGARARESLL